MTDRNNVHRHSVRRVIILALILSLSWGLQCHAKLKNAKGTIVYTGDSRFHRMYYDQHIKDTGDVFRFSKNSITAMGYQNDVMPKLCEYLNKRKNVTVVVCIGINDLSNLKLSAVTAKNERVKRIFRIYRKLIRKYSRRPYRDHIFIKSIDPTGKVGYAKKYKNKKVVKLNKLVRKKFKKYYLDSYSFVWNYTGGRIDPYTTDTGTNAVKGHDGLHYNKKMNRILHNWIREQTGIE